MFTYDYQDGWIIHDRAAYQPDDEVSKATVFALANGYMGVRGASESVSPRLKGVVGCHINGLYDSPTGGILDREMIALPAWTSFVLEAEGETLTVENASDYVRSLEMRRGLLLQTMRWRTRSGVEITLASERFVSLARLHLGLIQWSLLSDSPCTVTVRSLVDADVNNRWADTHFASVQVRSGAGSVGIATIEQDYLVQVAVRHAASLPVAWRDCSTDRALCAACEVTLQAGQTVTLHKLAAVYDNRFSSGDLDALAQAELDAAQAAGYDALRREHEAAWAARWNESDVVIEGDEVAQIAMRFCLFHLLANAPHSERVSISARGLQGQDYWGSIFWDCDIYVLPFFTSTQPEFARRSLIYRYHTLAGAKRKAVGMGYQGAYYAWQSQETGDETCALYVFDNPFTGEKIRSYFADEQIHISADVVYALWQYVRATGDEAFLRDYGLAIACEVTRFFVSRAAFNAEAGRYELRTVLGPDEYHERVDNNAYTNALAQYSLDTTLAALERVRAFDPAGAEHALAVLNVTADEIARWREVAAHFYVPAPDAATGLISQFDGYFDLEDALPDAVRPRLAHPDLHPGGPLGPYQTTQSIKQADTVLLTYLLRERYPAGVRAANWDYYEPRTSHDSSLSPMAYALVAAGLNRLDWAYRYFLRTALMDLDGSGPHWNLGIHTAAMGGAWLVVAHGFCHLDLRDDGVHLLDWPRLPAGWERLQLSFRWHGHLVRLTVTRSAITLTAESGSVPLHHPAGQAVLQPAQLCTLPVDG
jgi:kojibiose phosphorylase